MSICSAPVRLGLLVVCLAAAPASAQSQFHAACVASGQGDNALPPGVAEAICGCTESTALTSGLSAEDLDEYLAFTRSAEATGQTLQVMEDAPENMIAASSVLIESMTTCISSGAIDLAVAQSPPPAASPPAVTVAAETEVGGRTITREGGATVQPAPAPALAAGLRTGDGRGPVQARQEGNGAAIRIVQ